MSVVDRLDRLDLDGMEGMTRVWGGNGHARDTRRVYVCVVVVGGGGEETRAGGDGDGHWGKRGRAGEMGVGGMRMSTHEHDGKVEWTLSWHGQKPAFVEL